MSSLSIIAFIFGAAGVWLTIRQTTWCWPVSLVAVMASVAEFYNERLFGDMALQVFYFFAGVYGWVFWKKNSGRTFHIKNMPPRIWIAALGATAAQSALYYYIIRYFRGDRVLLDAILTASSLTATYMMIRKWIENWITWVVIDCVYVYLYSVKDMWLFAALYLVFAAMAFYGWRSWVRSRVIQISSSWFLVPCSWLWLSQ